MKKIYNFNAGPGLLPPEVLQSAQEALKSFAGTGIPVLSVSHRSREWGEVMDETRALWRSLMGIPDDYEVLLLSGGASMQFCMVPFNLLERDAACLETGLWSQKAIREARGFGHVTVVASSEDRNFNYIPRGYEIPRSSDYFYLCTSNSVYGTQVREDPVSPIPMVADMSSDILSRKIKVNRYGLIFAGAQKNAGTAGVTVVIVRRDILGHVSRYIPNILDYRTHIEHNSMFNTPPVFPILVMRDTLRWLDARGGVEAVSLTNREKAAMLYAEIDRNSLFRGTADVEDRSMMNVRFVTAEGRDDLTDRFVEYASERGIVGIRGHRTVGGFRASIYNACTVEAVQALTNCMREFEREFK